MLIGARLERNASPMSIAVARTRPMIVAMWPNETKLTGAPPRQVDKKKLCVGASG
jgi:hypothetical protein